MLIRNANLNDIETLLNFGMKLHLIEKEFEPTLSYSKTEYFDKYSKQIKNPLALFLIIENSDALPVGYLYAHIEKTNSNSKISICELEVVYILPEFRGKGLTTDLINECFIWVKNKNISKIKTEIFAKNVVSRKVFEKIGFKEHSLSYSIDLDD